MKNKLRKSIFVLSAVCITLLLFSSATAVPHVHSAPAVKLVKQAKQTKKILDQSKSMVADLEDISKEDFNHLITKVRNVVDSKKFNELVAQIKEKIDIEKFIEDFKKYRCSLTNKVKDIESEANLESFVHTIKETLSNSLRGKLIGPLSGLLAIIWTILCSFCLPPSPLWLLGLLGPGTLSALLSIVYYVYISGVGGNYPTFEGFLTFGVLGFLGWPIIFWFIGLIILGISPV